MCLVLPAQLLALHRQGIANNWRPADYLAIGQTLYGRGHCAPAQTWLRLGEVAR